MQNKPLLFDEFDIKECATTDTLKRGKKAFQNHTIHDVTLTTNALQGTYIRGKVKRTVKISKKDTKLIGTIDEIVTRPFTAPLTALAFWYIDFINKNKAFASAEASNENTLEPFESIQLTFIYDAEQNKINLTLYQPKTNAYCNESHLFIHTFHQLIQHFDSTSQSIIQKLGDRYDDIFYYHSNWVKNDAYISQQVIQLIKLNGLYNQSNQKITLMPDPIHLKITCKIKHQQILISFIWITDDKETAISVYDAMQCEKTNHIIYGSTCYQIQNPLHSKIAAQFKQQSFQRLNISKIKPFINKLVELRKKAGLELAIDANIQKLKKIDIQPQCIIDATPTNTGGTLTIHYQYNTLLILTSNPSPYLIFDDYTYTERQFKMEHELRDILLHYHPSSTEENSITYASPYFDQIVSDIKQKHIENIKLSADSAKIFTLSKTKITAKLEFKESGNALKTTIQWTHPNKKPLTQKLYHHIQHGISCYIDQQTNTIIPIEKSPMISTLTEQTEHPIPIGVAIFIALNTSIAISVPKHIQQIINALKHPSKISIDKQTNRILRPFQNEGLKWLLSLNNTQLNGILADDMGLGKTIQSIMLLKETQKKQSAPSIIIMPKTLLFNWEKELQTFAPSLTICRYDGPKRKQLIKSFNNTDIILCSYTSIRLDIKLLKDITFHWLILDEAQYVKNHTTNTFKAIKKIKTEKRLLLTGTPLENSIGDLWSLMDIANPNYFGRYKALDEFYSDPAHQSVLKAAIAPLMLRRRKKDVLKDLPSVTIQELWASPSPEEINAYTTFAKQEWKRVEAYVEKDGLEKSKVHIFALMTKLRQWCAHPKLITDTTENGPKWLVFIDRLLEAISNGHKVVVFSQFIPMIQTMEEALNESAIPVVTLTGQTKDREHVIETFNNNDDIRVGLFSLKAGGVGINLTSADYVFLYDPWWNPAVEQQAIDRVHRIGQDQPVMVFKCLVAETIEERMINYQNQKKELIDSIIEEQSIKNLNIHEIKTLIGI